MKSGIINVRGADYRWSVFSEPRWATGRFEETQLRGLAILVESLQPSRRQLLLEFSIDPSRHGDMPQHQRFRIHDGRLTQSIEDAINAGWDPVSRGKRFIHEAGQLQPR
jgi:hypothetical protein